MEKINKSAYEKIPKIIVVDDSPANLLFLSKKLQKMGYEIIEVTSGEEALEKVEEFLPDLVLLDIIMPGIDGFEVCSQLKDNEVTCEIPIIFITVKDDKKSIVKGFQSGAVDYLTRPYNTDELFARVKTHIDLKLARDSLKNMVNKLAIALEDIKKLTGLMPICASCKNIRNDKGYWESVEHYITEHSEVRFTHSICPKCRKKLYPEYGSDN
ncbi:two-component system response regulator [candidate division KSB1 bacterium]